jgi:RHH-type proline utilization regulon transcriptional repressor/proline dehydrogenase/delta 1-pyrroline-5-carboxylate dehydrogenase
VGVQPFGGGFLSGTGPKAGGPLYLRRLVHAPPCTLAEIDLPGPAGEQNILRHRPRGGIAACGPTPSDLAAQLAIIAQTGNVAITGDDGFSHPNLAAVLYDGPPDELLKLNQRLAARPGPIIQIFTPDADGAYHPEHLLREICISTNTAAAGGNASLLAIA